MDLERDYGVEAQKAAEQHLEAIYEFEETYLEEYPNGDVMESPSVGPWCGCLTCVVRETLHAAWPSLREAARIELTLELQEG